MKKLLSIILLCFAITISFVKNSCAITKDEVVSFIDKVDNSFSSKDLEEVASQASEKYMYISTITVDGLVYKHELNKDQFLYNTVVLFKSGGNFETSEFEIEDIDIQGKKAYVKMSILNSYSLDGITQKCTGATNYEIEKINGILKLNRTQIIADCVNYSIK